MTESNEIPRVKSIREKPNPSAPGHLLVWITCPYCGEEHQHDMSETEHEGHRGSHCIAKDSNPGYIIVRN